MDEERIFTLSEASQLIPQLRTILIEASEEFSEMRRLNPQIQKVRDKVPLDGFSPEGVPYVQAATHQSLLDLENFLFLFSSPGHRLNAGAAN